MINPKSMMFATVMLCLVVAVSCSDDSETQKDSSVSGDLTADAKGSPDKSTSPDLGQLPDLGKQEPCASEWRDAVSPQKKVTTGKVTTTAGTVNITMADATAGGMSSAHLNPFVYISFKDGSRVDVDDFAAKTSTAWDLALRRTVIRLNGGDSGAGKGAVAIVAGKKLADVTSLPAASSFNTDDFLDASCTIKRNAINNIWTAFTGTTGMWYDYGSGTHLVEPKAVVYVLRRAGGEYVKLTIDSFYNSSNTSGHFKLSWSAIK